MLSRVACTRQRGDNLIKEKKRNWWSLHYNFCPWLGCCVIKRLTLLHIAGGGGGEGGFLGIVVDQTWINSAGRAGYSIVLKGGTATANCPWSPRSAGGWWTLWFHSGVASVLEPAAPGNDFLITYPWPTFATATLAHILIRFELINPIPSIQRTRNIPMQRGRDGSKFSKCYYIGIRNYKFCKGLSTLYSTRNVTRLL